MLWLSSTAHAIEPSSLSLGHLRRAADAHADTDQCLKGGSGIVLQVLVPDNLAWLEHAHDCASAELEVAELWWSVIVAESSVRTLTVSTLHSLTLHNRIHDRADH